MSKSAKRKAQRKGTDVLTKGAQDRTAAIGGRFVQRSNSKLKASGVHGQNIINGLISTNEKQANLIGRNKYKTFSDMIANVTIVANGIRYFLNLCGKADWRVEPPKDSGEEGQRFADLTWDIMNDMRTPWHRCIRAAAMFRYYGFNIQEKTFKRRPDGHMGYADLGRRPQQTIERWDVENDGTIRGVIQRSPQTFKELYMARSRLVYMVDDALNDSPEGLGLFRHMVEPAKRLRKLLQLEGWGYENDLRGVPIIRAPLMALMKAVADEEITEEQAEKLLAPLKLLADVHARNPEMGIIIDSQTWQTADEASKPSGTPQFDIGLLDGGTYSLKEVHDAIVRTNLEIARLLGIEHMLLGSDGQGSLALAKDKSDNFALTVDATLKEIRTTYQRDYINDLWEINGWPEEMKPTLEHEQILNRDINRIAEALTALAESGIILSRNDKAVSEFLKLMGLSRLEDLEEIDPDLYEQLRTKAGVSQSADSKAQQETAKVTAEAQAKAAANTPQPTTKEQ